MSHRLRRVATLCTLAGLAISTHAQTTVSPRTQSLKWSNGQSTAVSAMSRAQVAQQIKLLSERAPQSHVLVHFAMPITELDRAQLKAQGLTLTTSLGGTSYFASLRGDANHQALSRSTISNIASIARPQKLHTDLEAGIFRSWMIDKEAMSKAPNATELVESGMVSQAELQEIGIDPNVIVIVMYHTDVDRAQASAELSDQFGSRVIREVQSINSVSMLIRSSQVKQLAEDDRVMWVEPPLPALDENNAENRALTEVDMVNSAPYSLDGSGVTVLVYDAGKAFQHNDFGSRLTIGISDTDSISGHATHVAGTIGGDGSGNSNHRGMAPGVDLISYGFEVPGGLQPGFLYTDPGDVEADYTEAINLYGADLSNNSIGSNVESNGYNCDWHGDYGTTAALIDSIARGSIGNPFRIVWAAGNERQGSRCDIEGFGDFYSVAPPGSAKNHITVGSVDADTDLISSFSSWGPTDDGRLKPDISAPGCQDGGDGGVTSTSSSGGYTTFCGTSMAAPTTAGISALILEQYRITFPDRDDFMNATLKALLANSAVDRGRPGPDFEYGYGSVRATNAVDTVLDENIVENEVTQGGTFRAIVIVNPGETELRVTAAWDDAPAAPNVGNALVNDLDLRLIDASGTVYLPWTLDPSSPGSNAVQNVRDGRNNIEQVSIMNPAPGAYTVEVVGFNVADGPSQTFGLVSSSTLINCSSAGIVGIGGSVLPCSGFSTVQVVDCDLNTSDSVIDTVDVMLESSVTPGSPIMLTLTESAPESATFTGSFSYADTAGSDLLVNHGATITATYIDADDGIGNMGVLVTSQASVDCAPPEIRGISFSEIEPRDAVANVSLDEPASVTLRYGTSPGQMNQSVSSSARTNMHSISITGLQDETTYYVAILAEDVAGNMSMDNNGGAGYSFMTPDIPDFFTEEFGSGLDLEGLQITFSPSMAVDGYVAHVQPLDGGVLPYEPTDGSSIPLSDDDSELVSVTGGNSVWLYGQPYNSVYVGSNGYLTLGSSDTDYTESIDDHFDQPRISGLFDDLNPSSSGTVYSQQLSDRLVVSYDQVTEYSSTNQNTFQIELHFDGTIVMSWERIDSGDAIVGLSEGEGQDPDFFESDLSNYPAPSSCLADFNGDGVLDFFDVSAFVNAYNASDPSADLNGDGGFDFFDISIYVNAYTAGCP
jgi:hypothetical protein